MLPPVEYTHWVLYIITRHCTTQNMYVPYYVCWHQLYSVVTAEQPSNDPPRKHSRVLYFHPVYTIDDIHQVASCGSHLQDITHMQLPALPLSRLQYSGNARIWGYKETMRECLMTCYVWCSVMHTCCITCFPPHPGGWCWPLLSAAFQPSVCVHSEQLLSEEQRKGKPGRIIGEERERNCVEALCITACMQKKQTFYWAPTYQSVHSCTYLYTPMPSHCDNYSNYTYTPGTTQNDPGFRCGMHFGMSDC